MPVPRRDSSTASLWFALADIAGQREGSFNLGVVASRTANTPAAWEAVAAAYRRAAEKGMASAQYHLGKLLDEGKAGQRDPAAAALWLEKAANQGNTDAMNHLAVLYEEGDGVTKNLAKAVKLKQKAADKAWQSVPR